MGGRRQGAGGPPSHCCVVYSAGFNSNDEFERAEHERAPACEIHVFDPTSPPIKAGHFNSVGLLAKDGTFEFEGQQYPSRSVAFLMRERGHSHIDILKIDGSELARGPALVSTEPVYAWCEGSLQTVRCAA